MGLDLEVLRAEARDSFRRAVELQAALDVAEGRVPDSGVPHYNVIEEAAHRVGREISRMVQERHLGEVVARQHSTGACPTCGSRCDLSPRKRTVTSGDGPIELQELIGHCPGCRRDFFPST